MADGVVVLHGIFRTHRSMRGLSKFLEASGFKVLNLGYPSTKYPIQELAEFIHPSIEAFVKHIDGRLHFVGYSMGGLLIRAYLKKYPLKKLGRVVMIGTPNAGSEVADFLKNNFLYKKLYGPAGQQLITDQSKFKDIFENNIQELGVISGNAPLDLISSAIIAKPNDGKVSIQSSLLAGAKDHIILPCSHTFFPSQKIMWQEVLYFFQRGSFNSSK